MSESNSGYLTPSDVTSASFEPKRRGGVDPDAVKKHLKTVAETVSGLTAERDALAEQVSSLEADLAKVADVEAPEPRELTEDEITERLGQDAMRVLAEARAAAADRLAEAEVEADGIRAAAEELHAQRSAEADEEAQRIRAGAEQVLEDRRTEAEKIAATIIADAEADAGQVRSAGSSERETADAEAARIIREAELTRRQILEDLARRRSAARRQIEQLRAGRERLLASHETVRRALDEISEELTISMSEARAAAETAGHTVSDTTIEELEAEIETARLTGLLDTGPLPVIKKETPSAQAPKNEPATEPVSTESRVVEAEAAAPVEEELPPAETSAKEDQLAADHVDDVDEDAAAEVPEADDAATSASDSSAAPTPKDLAPVVQLDRARGEVDTASHPAKGRDAAASSSTKESTKPQSAALPSKKALEAKDKARDNSSKSKTSSKKATVTKLESVKSPSADGDPGVDDLFANLRSATEKPAPKKAAKKKTAKKSTSAKKKSTKSSTAKKAAEELPEVDSSEMARRLKRVLADEQSKAMSTVKNADNVPGVESLLGSTDTHIETYWAEVLGQLDNPADASDAARTSVSNLVDGIRRRVTDALENADDDKEAAVAALRSVYREVKTQQISGTADAVVRSMADSTTSPV